MGKVVFQMGREYGELREVEMEIDLSGEEGHLSQAEGVVADDWKARVNAELLHIRTRRHRLERNGKTLKILKQELEEVGSDMVQPGR